MNSRAMGGIRRLALRSMLNTIAWVAASSQVPSSYENSGSRGASMRPVDGNQRIRAEKNLRKNLRKKKTASAFGGGKAGGPPNTLRRSAVHEDSNLPRR